MAEQSAGLIESLKRLVSTLTSIISTRLELLANELQEERLRLTQMLVFALISLFCFGMSILLFTGFIVVLFWDDHRVAALGGLGTMFLALGMLMAILLRNKAHAKPRLFSASLGELAKDRDYLDSHHE
ncbi:MAG: phage holin family protein [Gallionella sp.]